MSAERFVWQQLRADQPSLFHFPVGDEWWWHSTEQHAVLDSGTLLRRAGNDVLIHRKVASGDVLVGPEGIGLRAPEPAFRTDHRWSHPSGALPLGAQRARRLWTSPCGTARLWDDDFWLYRQHHGQAPEALGRIHADDDVFIGPRGAVLLCRRDMCVAGASPDGPLLSLGLAADAEWWGVRWSPDGNLVAQPGSESVSIDLRTAGLTPCATWPANADGSAYLNETLTELTTPSGVVPLPTCSTARLGPLLAGPGGVSWDLYSGQQLFHTPVWRLGATVAVSEQRFFTVDYESGEGEWIHPRTGAHLAALQLPLHEDELVDEGWAHEDTAFIGLSSGRVLAVKADTAREVDAEAPAPERRLHLKLPLRWDHAAVVADHTWVWSESGLLLALPSRR